MNQRRNRHARLKLQRHAATILWPAIQAVRDVVARVNAMRPRPKPPRAGRYIAYIPGQDRWLYDFEMPPTVEPTP